MQEELIKVLTDLGLTEKESRVYLATTEVGTGVVSQIAQKAKINRVTAYDILEKLKVKGLVSYFSKKKIKYFSALSPQTVLEEFEKRTENLRTSLPKFKRLMGETAHPRVRYFEGIEGIKAIYTDTLSAKSEILNFSNSKEIRKQWPNYDKEYVEQRAKKGIYLRGICPQDKAGELVHSEDKKYFRKMRLMPSDQFDFTNEINIYDDKVAIISLKDELIGMIIECNEIANSQRAIFNMCWQFTQSLKDHSEAKTKMLTPMSEKEVKTQIEREAQPLEPRQKESNLSLF